MYGQDMKDKREIFIEKAKEVHKGENIDYSKVVYVNNRTKVCLIDHDLKPDGTEYGEFWQTPYNHLRGQSHPLKKGNKISKNKSAKQDEIIRRFKEVHKDENMDYSQVVYKNMHTKVKIICHDLRPDGTEYGEFWQEPVVHLKGCSHPDKGRYKQIQSQMDTTDSFIEKAKEIQADKDYDFSKVKYKDTWTKVEIICKEHGSFFISPNHFLQGKGCPICGNHLSIAQDELFKFIQKLLPNETIIKNDKKTLNGSELDIYVPSYHFAIEYNGLRWHSEEFNKDRDYHLNKTLKCEEKGIKLIHIFEDEYIDNKTLIYEKLKHFLKINNNLPKVAARKCIIKEINKSECEAFLNKYHIQGFTASSVYVGCFNKDLTILYAVMTFKKTNNENTWYLTRFASDYHYICQGIGGKLFSFFIRHYQYNKIISFLDRRWCFSKTDNIYTKLGFKFICYTKPDYRYTNGHGERLHKFGFRKNILHRKYGLPLSMTEYEMTQQLKYYRIWDCGLLKYEYKKDDED